MIECFVRIVAVMVNIFRLGLERKLVDTPLTNEKTSELSRHSHRGYLARVECRRGKSSTICRLRRLTGGNRYRFAGFCFLEWMAFCHDTSFRLEVCPRAVLCAVLFMRFELLHRPVVMRGKAADKIRTKYRTTNPRIHAFSE